MELLYHCNFAAPFLDAGARIVAPSVEVVPRDARAAEDVATYATYAAATPDYVEQVYYHKLSADAAGNTLVMLRNRAGDKGVVLRFNTDELPCFTQWKNTATEGDGYVTGLEPGVNHPNAKVYERENGRVVTLPPGGDHRTKLVFEVLTSSQSVDAVAAEATSLLGDGAPTVHTTPRRGWTPEAD